MKAKNTKKPSSKTATSTSTTEAAPTTPVVHDFEAYVAEHGEALRGYPTKRVRIQVSTLVEHAGMLLQIAWPHREKLYAVGLEPRHLESLPHRVALAKACQSIRQTDKAAFSDEELAAIKKCKVHRDEMMRICRHAFRKMGSVQETLTKLQEGASVQDLLEDSRALRGLITTHHDLVVQTGSDPERLKSAAISHETAIEHIANARNVRVKGGSIVVSRRNQSVHYLLEALREVRDNAAFAFAKDEKISAVLQGLGTVWQTAKKASEDPNESDDSTDEEDQVPTE